MLCKCLILSDQHGRLMHSYNLGLKTPLPAQIQRASMESVEELFIGSYITSDNISVIINIKPYAFRIRNC